MSLTEKGKMVLDVEFDSLEDIRLNYFPERTEEEIIASLNSIGESDFEVVGVMEIFFEGIDYGRKSLLNRQEDKEN